MRGHKYFVLIFLSIFGLACGDSQSKNSIKVTGHPDPSTQGPYEQAVGIYYEGHLINAMDIGLSGPGFIKLFTHRSTGWGTFDVIALIKQAADKLISQFPNQEPLQIGDICSQHGGPLLSHLSHQNGLDADIRLLAKNHHVQSPETLSGFDESYVVNGKISPNFDYERNWLLIKTLVNTERINRIFLDKVIKKALCKYAKSINEAKANEEALRRIEHFDEHTDHIHIRLTCPQNSPHCQSQEDPPDDGNCTI
jgi:penicillin-insensitive murein endopeptidase